jgi:hypothetical protein
MEIGKLIKAQDGFEFKLKGHTDTFGHEVYTGYVYYADGLKLAEPIFLDDTTLEEIEESQEVN